MSKPYDQKRAFELASFKASDDVAGEFEALVSVFGNVDLGGDRVVRGAFAKSLARWQEKGDPIPVIWNHMWENPEAHIGAVYAGDAVETGDGLLVKGRLDLDNPFAKQVYRLLSERRVKEFSFGYNTLDAERKGGALELRELDLIEVGPTLKGMNPATELLAVKALAKATEPTAFDKLDAAAAELKAPRTVGGALRQLRRQVSDINELLASIDFESVDETPGTDDAKAGHGTASDPDQDIQTEIDLLRGKLP